HRRRRLPGAALVVEDGDAARPLGHAVAGAARAVHARLRGALARHAAEVRRLTVADLDLVRKLERERAPAHGAARLLALERSLMAGLRTEVSEAPGLLADLVAEAHFERAPADGAARPRSRSGVHGSLSLERSTGVVRAYR